MNNRLKSEIKSYLRFMRNFSISILLIVILMMGYYIMLIANDYAFERFNEYLGLTFSCLFLIGILYLHFTMINNAIRGKKGAPTPKNSPHNKVARKAASPEEAAQEKEIWKKTNRRITMAVTQLIVVNILVRLLWWIPTWPRWIVLFLAVGGISYFLSRRFGERRGLYSGLGQFAVIFLGWLLGRWLGIIFFSVPLLLVYYLMLYQFTMAIIPANTPDSPVALFDSKNEKWLRFRAFFFYTWGMQYPMNVVVDEWGREIAMRIKGSPFPPIGNPGVLLTHAHQVAGVTAGTEFARIDGSGTIFTKRFERSLEIIDLRRQVRIKWIDAETKDGIPFKAKLFMVFQVDTSSPDRGNGAFPYSTKWIRRLLILLGMFQSPSSGKINLRWDERVVKLYEQAALQTLSKRTLNELWQPQNSDKYSNAFVEIGDQIRENLQNKLSQHRIIVHTSRMPEFKFYDDDEKDDYITPQQLETWQSSWARQAKQTIAEGDAQAKRLQENARAYAQSVLLKELAEGIKQTSPEISRYVIAIRFVNAIQELAQKQIIDIKNPEETERLEDIKRIKLP